MSALNVTETQATKQKDASQRQRFPFVSDHMIRTRLLLLIGVLLILNTPGNLSAQPNDPIADPLPDDSITLPDNREERETADTEKAGADVEADESLSEGDADTIEDLLIESNPAQADLCEAVCKREIHPVKQEIDDHAQRIQKLEEREKERQAALDNHSIWNGHESLAWAPVWRSALVPGWGQVYRGDAERGYLYTGLALFFLLRTNNALNEYNQFRDNYNIYNTLSLLSTSFNKQAFLYFSFLRNDQNNSMIASASRYQESLTLFALVYFWNVADAWFSGERETRNFTDDSALRFQMQFYNETHGFSDLESKPNGVVQMALTLRY